MKEVTCILCDDGPVFTEEGVLYEHMEVVHLIYHHKCDNTRDGGVIKAVNSILRPN